MAVSPFEIIAAPATVYVAPVGETYPVIDADPAGKWVSLGETEGGVTVAHQHNVVELRTDQRIGIKKIVRSEETLRITFMMAELTLENMAKVLNDQTVTTVAPVAADAAANPPVDAAAGYREFDLYRGVQVNQLAMLIRGDSPYMDALLQYELPAVSQVGQPQVAFVKNDKSVMSLEWVVLEDPDATKDEDLFGRLIAQDAAATA